MTAALKGGEWSAALSGRTLPRGKTQYPFYRRLDGSQGRSGRAENLVPTGIFFNTSMFIALLLLHSHSHPFHPSKNQADWPQFLYCLSHSHRFTTPHHYPHWGFWNCFVTVALRSGRCYLLLPCTVLSMAIAILLSLSWWRMYLSHSLVQVYAVGGGGGSSAPSIVSPNNCLLFPTSSSPDSSSTAPCVGSRYNPLATLFYGYAVGRIRGSQIRSRTVQPIAQSLYRLSYPVHKGNQVSSKK